VTGNRQRQHLDALLEARERVLRLLRRPRRRDEPHFVEASLFAALLGEDQMAVMDRIKCAAENANSHDRLLPSDRRLRLSGS